MPALQTCVGTISYPHLYKARPRAEGNAELVFSTVLLLDEKQMRSPAYTAFRKAVDDFARQAYPKLVLGKGLVSPFRLCEEKENFPQGTKFSSMPGRRTRRASSTMRATASTIPTKSGRASMLACSSTHSPGSTAARRAFRSGCSMCRS